VAPKEAPIRARPMEPKTQPGVRRMERPGLFVGMASVRKVMPMPRRLPAW